MLEPLAFASELKNVLEQKPDVVLAYLVGSHARQEANRLSDVDIAALLAGRPSDDACFAARMDIMGLVMRILRVNDVDVAILNQAPLALRYRVVRDGRILFCLDENARVEFTARTVMQYLDFKPVIDVFERATLERARKGELLSGYNPHRGAVERYLRLRQGSERTPASDV